MRPWRTIEDRDIRTVIDLWKRCGLTRPWNDPVSDIALARRGQSSTVMVREMDDKIVAAVMIGHDGHRGTMYYVGVDPAYRKRKLGRELVQCAENWLDQHGIHKVNILVRSDNDEAMKFWAKLGYAASDVVSLQKAIKMR
jgi:ribosomal protein S18 acetylase RimI-like enzyme